MNEVDLQDKNVLIYGTGQIAGDIVTWCRQQNIRIVGVLDRVKMFGTFLGVPIVLWEDIQKGDVDVILIAASHGVYREIYERISPYCQSRKIQILGAYGQDLSDFFSACRFGTTFDSRCINKNALMDEIEPYDVVSFDVFDTVLMRLVYEPTDIFYIVEKKANQCGIQLENFKRVRREAELRSAGADIYRIYDILKDMLDLSDEERDLLLEIEIKAEFEYVVVREDIAAVIQEMKKRGKKVIYVSDMYLPAEIIKKLLVANHCYEGDGIFVSCDFGTSKVGGLFDYVANEYDVTRCIHVGDDIAADVKSPQMHGIQSIGIYKASDMFQTAGLGDVIGYMESLADRMLIGYIVNCLFNSPFAFENKFAVAQIDTIEKLADTFLLPVAVEYAKGLERCIRENDFEGVIFVARDGYFFNKLYDELVKRGLIEKLPTYYVLSSRILSVRVGVENESDIHKIFGEYALYDKKNVQAVIFGDSLAERMFEKKERDAVFEQFRRYRKSYCHYLCDCGINLKKNYLLCEFDGRGTGQYFMGKLFEKGLKGFYFFSILTQEPYDVERKFVHSVIDKKEYSPLEQNVPFLESCFSSPERSVCGINEDLSFEYKKEMRTQEEILFMENIQDVLLRKSADFIETIWEYDSAISEKLVEVLFDKISIVEFTGQAARINNIALSDELTDDVYDMKYQKINYHKEEKK